MRRNAHVGAEAECAAERVEDVDAALCVAAPVAGVSIAEAAERRGREERRGHVGQDDVGAADEEGRHEVLRAGDRGICHWISTLMFHGG